MKNMAILGIVAGAAAVTAIITTYKRKDGSRLTARLTDGVKNSINRLGNRIMDYSHRLKARLMHHVEGPHGEPVYLDMYDRQFYENETGKRVYLETV